MKNEHEETLERGSKRLKRDPANNTISVYSWNVSDLRPTVRDFLHSKNTISSYFTPINPPTSLEKTSSTRSKLRNILAHYDFPCIFCIQEVKLNREDEEYMQAAELAANWNSDTDGSPRYTLHWNLAHDRYDAGYAGGRMYGVCTLVRNDIALSRVERFDWDLEGRILCILVGNIRVFNIYAVNGTLKAYRDPETGHASGTRYDWKLRFTELLAEEVCRSPCILAGDFNVTRYPIDATQPLRQGRNALARAFFNEHFVSKLELCDTFRHLHPESREYSWHKPSAAHLSDSSRVDMIFLSRELQKKVVNAGIRQKKEDLWGSGDHTPIFMGLEASAFRCDM